MFRHERPQKGRYRQFHQVGVETFGMSGPDIDIELILMTRRLWQSAGIKGLKLELNSLGSSEEREAYRCLLIEWFGQHQSDLDEDSLRRLESNPLRILDSKNPQMAWLIENAPKLADILSGESREHFSVICKALDQAGIEYRINPCLVRGLDYYNKTVFEWVTDRLGAQATVCAGGRYDGLVEQLGGRATPAVGFALGMERLLALLEEDQPQAGDSSVDVYLVLVGDRAQSVGLLLAEKLRTVRPELAIVCHCNAGSFKSQFKKADKSGAKWAVVIGDDELDENRFGLKSLRDKQPQQLLDFDRLAEQLGQSATFATEVSP